jgi:hypothetical protein
MGSNILGSDVLGSNVPDSNVPDSNVLGSNDLEEMGIMYMGKNKRSDYIITCYGYIYTVNYSILHEFACRPSLYSTLGWGSELRLTLWKRSRGDERLRRKTATKT